MAEVYPSGLTGKRFLDCACNAGAYCFFARELGADYSFGFDVRQHWIDQAEFVRQHRVVGPVDHIEFRQLDLYDLPRLDPGEFDLTYFSGIFYHLPDPVTGLKIAADRTRDVIVLSTAMVPGEDNPDGLTIVRESPELKMSGVYELAWFPNNPETLKRILNWLGFESVKLVSDKVNPTSKRRRIKLLAAREKGRLDDLTGTCL